jgi:alanine racemase
VRQTAGWQKVRRLHPGRPTWLEVDLEAIAYNVRRVAEMVGPEVAILAVLKADGYGHGVVRVARTALNNGACYLGVASINEGAVLRQAGIVAPILVLGYTPAWQARELALNDLAATVFDLDVASTLSRAAKELDNPIRVHVKVDSGMGRLGLLPDEVVPFVLALRRLPGLALEGIFTHFSVADDDPAYTQWQLNRFHQVLEALEQEGVEFPLVHAANSAAILTLPPSHFTMVRLGIAMYGLDPSSQVRCPPDFRPALAFRTQVAQVKTLPPGSYVSYGNTYQTVGEQRIAVIPVGYADGFRRAPRHWGEVLVRGQRAPIVGRVCMDQTMIDVTAIPGVRQGDEVVLIGEQGQERITAEDVAERLGTINYEVVSEILARVPRVV